LEREIRRANRRIDHTDIRVTRDERRIAHIEHVVRVEFKRIFKIE